MKKMRYPNPEKDRPAAFTLIELLVVVAIITVLVGLLVPSLAGVRAAAKDVECKSNLHSIGQAIQLYLDDNNGYYPPMANLPTYEPVEHSKHPRPGMHEILGPFVGEQQEVFECPADKITNPGTKTSPGPNQNTYFEWQGSSYQPRGALSIVDEDGYWYLSKRGRMYGEDSTVEELKVLFANPTRIPIIHDFEPFHRARGQEGGATNALFADFHSDIMEEE